MKFRLYKSLLVGILAFQIGVGMPSLSWAPPPSGNGDDVPSAVRSAQEIVETAAVEAQEHPAVQRALARIDAWGDYAIQESRLGNAPTETRDPFRLGNQEVRIYQNYRDNVRYESIRLEAGAVLPEVDFPYLSMKTPLIDDIKIIVDREGRQLILRHQKGKVIIADHVFHNIEVVDVLYDTDFVALLEADGRIWVLDSLFVRQRIFKDALPQGPIGQIRNMPADTANVELAHLSRGTRPPIEEIERTEERIRSILDLIQGEPIYAGDYIARINDGDTYQILEGRAPRQRAFDVMKLAFGVLGVIAGHLDPSVRPTQMVETSQVFLEDEGVRTEGPAVYRNMGEVAREAAMAYSPESVEAMLSCFGKCDVQLRSPRDAYLVDEWLDRHAQYRSIARETEDFGRSSGPSGISIVEAEERLIESQRPEVAQMSTLRRFLTSTTFRLFTIFGAGGLLVNASANASSLLPAWLADTVFNLTDVFLWVLIDAVNSPATLIAIGFVLFWVVVTDLVGLFAGRAMGGLDFRVAQAYYGKKIFGFLGLPIPFWGPVLYRQVRNVLPRGFRAALVSVSENDRRRRSAIRGDRRRIQTLAWSFAAMFTENPAAVTLIASGELTSADLAADPNSRRGRKAAKLMTETARVLATRFSEMDSGLVRMDLHRLMEEDPELLQHMVVEAMKAEEEIRNEPAAAAFAKRHLPEFLRMMGRAAAYFPKRMWGDFKLLWDTLPTHFAAFLVWKKKWFDFGWSPLFFGSLGDFAFLGNPSVLFGNAEANGFMSAQPMAEEAEQLAHYSTRVQGVVDNQTKRLTAGANLPTETAFDPLELLEIVDRPQTFFEGMGEYVRAATNLRQANYGGWILQDLMVRITMVQFFLIAIIGVTHVVAGLALGAATIKALYIILMSVWSFAGLWQLVSGSLKSLEINIERRVRGFRQAIIRASQGSRLGNIPMAQDGVRQLVRLFNEDRKFHTPRPVVEALQTAEMLLGVASEDRRGILDEYERVFSALVYLDAMNERFDGGTVSEAELRAAMESVIALYDGNMSADEQAQFEAMTGRDLARFAAANPPIPTSPNGSVDSLIVFGASVSTTVLYTFLATAAYAAGLAQLAYAAIYSTLAYTTTGVVQAGINRLWPSVETIASRRQARRDRWLENRPESGLIRVCGDWVRGLRSGRELQ